LEVDWCRQEKSALDSNVMGVLCQGETVSKKRCFFLNGGGDVATNRQGTTKILSSSQMVLLRINDLRLIIEWPRSLV
jgi:hypothetical protein